MQDMMPYVNKFGNTRMSERIRELFEQAGLRHYGEDYFAKTDKFAELIVRECAVYCAGHILPTKTAEENALNYNDGVMDCAIGLKQHFGVEE
jgi:coproporphyrinogen III oxidase-like Fe-S oxidoreductase